MTHTTDVIVKRYGQNMFAWDQHKHDQSRLSLKLETNLYLI